MTAGNIETSTSGGTWGAVRTCMEPTEPTTEPIPDPNTMPVKGTYARYLYERPEDWLEIDSLIPESSIEGKVVLLMQVSKYGTYLNIWLRDNKDAVIDWGDGNINEETSEYKTHTIEFDSLPANTELDNGLRQCIITITKGEDPLSFVVLQGDCSNPVEMVGVGTGIRYFRHNADNMRLFYLKGENSLIERPAAPINCKYYYYKRYNSGGINLSNIHRGLDRYYVQTVDITDMNSAYTMCYQSHPGGLTLIGTPTRLWSGYYMYGYLKYGGEMKVIDYSLCRDFYMFAYGSYITYTPLIDMRSATRAGRAFMYCRELETINIINCGVSTDFRYCGMLPLKEIIKFGIDGIVDLTGEDGKTILIDQSKADKELTNMGSEDVIAFRGVDYTKDDILDIFLNKNWTLVL